MPSEDVNSSVPARSSLTLRKLLETLGQVDLESLDPELELIELAQNEVLFRQGDVGDGLYIVIAGMLGVKVEHEDGSESVIDKLSPGAMVGEMALLTGQPRTATVFALNDVGLIRLSKPAFDRLAAQEEPLLADISEALAPRWQRLQLARVLTRLFGDLDVTTLHELQARLEWRHVSNGEVIFSQGDPPDGMVIVVNGRLRISTTSPEGDEIAIGEVGSGETVGEFGLLTDQERTATVYAVRESNVVKMTPAVFERLVRDHPRLLRAILDIIITRRQRALRRPAGDQAGAKVIALVPVNPEVEADTFSAELAKAFAVYGKTLALNCLQFDELYGQPGAAQSAADDPSNPAVVAWMGGQEMVYQYLIYVADPNWSGWTQRCVGQADRVLLLAHPQGDTAQSPVELALSDMRVPVRTELVLWHPAGSERANGTAAWLAARTVQAHHHVRRGNASDVGRLVRRMTGRAIALVFSGGAARGFAHLGVYWAFDELGIPIDYFGGTSMGAMLAAGLAIGLTYKEGMALAAQLGTRKAIFDYTLPLTSLMASRKVTAICRRVFAEWQIEDLWVPYFCVSSNLSRAEPMVHRQGPLWRAVRASIAIPGIFTPFMEESEVLVDGGVMDNFPVDVMSQLSESSRVIGVHVSPHQDKKRHYDLNGGISGWRVLISRINPFARRLRTPSLAGIILRSLEVNSLYRSKGDESLADLVIHPDVKSFGILDFDSYEPIVDMGYRVGLEKLRAWKERQSVL